MAQRKENNPHLRRGHLTEPAGSGPRACRLGWNRVARMKKAGTDK
jgi:hypothetical protein